MDEASLTDLVTTIADRLCGTHELLYVTLIRQLAAGQPVSATRLAAHLAMEEPEVGAVLRQMSDVDYDAAGNVVGFGLSLVPTAHQFTINGRTLYTWCALDTFCTRRCLPSQPKWSHTVRLLLALSRWR